ncbi:MAG: Uma2 family endonuclease [Deltaproteobacteria bacterium]|nr:Uma2 family endonuclease [Deltaproteobacteria bacterium]
MPLPSQTNGKLTYADYVSWPEGERWELIDGEAYDMTPAPTSRHQRISGRLFFVLEGALRGSPCVPFYAPVNVVLSEVDVVQPDMLVVCDRDKITPDCIRGVPDLVVEILSPSTALKDRRSKKHLYERSGVREYLIVEPEARYVERFALEAGGSFGMGEIFGPPEVLALKSLQGIELALSDIFEPDIVPSGSGPPR